MELKKIRGDIDGAYGIIFCAQDDYNYYTLVITANGEIYIDKTINDEAIPIYDWDESLFLLKGYNVSNKIGITYDKDKKEFSVFINGIREIIFQDNTFTGGKYGAYFSVTENENFPEEPEEIEIINKGKFENPLFKEPKLETFKTINGMF